MHTTFNITIMMDLFLIAMAVVNALLLLAFYRILHVNPEAKNKMFYFQFNDGLDWIAGGLHIVADILIITLRYLRHRQPNA